MGMFTKIVAVDSDGAMHVILRCVIIISAGPSNPSGAVDTPEKAKKMVPSRHMPGCNGATTRSDERL